MAKKVENDKNNPEKLTAKVVSLEDVLKGAKPWEDNDLSTREACLIRRYYIDLLRMEGYNPYSISKTLDIPYTTVRNDFKATDKEDTKGELAELREQRRSELYRRYLRIAQKAEKHRQDELRELSATETETTYDKNDKITERVITTKTLHPREKAANEALKIQLEAYKEIAGLYGLDSIDTPIGTKDNPQHTVLSWAETNHPPFPVPEVTTESDDDAADKEN